MAKTILVVDDEEHIRSLMATYLEQAGYRVVGAADGQEALYVARHEKPDLIVLDLMMPEVDGYEFMRRHHREKETPIIVLTARVDESDRIVGLELGADDYVTKPFSPKELVARVRAVLRRSARQEQEPDVVRIADLTVDRDAHRVRVGADPVDLTPLEFELLSVLASAPDRAFSRYELLDRIQGDAYDGYERTIDTHIKNLRAKIETDPSQPRYILTVFGVGYRLAGEEA